MENQWKALYLTFILYKEGLALKDISGNKEFYDIFVKIVKQLPKSYKIPTMEVVYDNVKSTRSRISKTIFDATKDNLAKEKFGIEGYGRDVFKVAGATDDNRDVIRKEFGLE